MGQSTDGIICYGFLYGEECEEFPWDEEKWEGDFEEWWAFGFNGAGYVPACQPWTDKGGYAEGFDENSDLKPYFAAKKVHKAKVGPPPVEWVNTCSYECPVWILAVPGTVVTASRGHPESLKTRGVNTASCPPLGDIRQFRAFCAAHSIEVGELGWLLGSFYG